MRMEKGGNLLYAIEHAELGHIGNISATFDRFNYWAELSILVGEPQARGRGLGMDAWITAGMHVLSLDQIKKVWAGAAVGNQAMIQIFKKSKMQEDGVQRRHHWIEGNYQDLQLAAWYR